jgi:hypothetical protein
MPITPRATLRNINVNFSFYICNSNVGRPDVLDFSQTTMPLNKGIKTSRKEKKRKNVKENEKRKKEICVVDVLIDKGEKRYFSFC